MESRKQLICNAVVILILVSTVNAEASPLQLGALQAQAVYAPALLQGARAASRSAASCLVTAVQYTHGQQIWRADPCEFCLCLDGEMFCWWQECPPEARRPCPSSQPYALCGNSSSMDKPPSPIYRKQKKAYHKTTQSESTTRKANTSPSASVYKPRITSAGNDKKTIDERKREQVDKKGEKEQNATNATPSLSVKSDSSKWRKYPNKKYNKKKDESKDAGTSNDNLSSSYFYDGGNNDDEMRNKSSSDILTKNKKVVQPTAEPPRDGCIVMGKEYTIGQTLPSTGTCLVCRCVAGFEHTTEKSRDFDVFSPDYDVTSERNHYTEQASERSRSYDQASGNSRSSEKATGRNHSYDPVSERTRSTDSVSDRSRSFDVSRERSQNLNPERTRGPARISCAPKGCGPPDTNAMADDPGVF